MSSRRGVLISGGDSREVTGEEIQCLAWMWDLIGHEDGSLQGSCVGRLFTSGGEFNKDDGAEVKGFCQQVRSRFPDELRVWAQKYGSNLCLGSQVGFALVLSLSLPYRNLNTKDEGVFRGKRRYPGEAATLGDIPPLVAVVAALEKACDAGAFRLELDDALDFF